VVQPGLGGHSLSVIITAICAVILAHDGIKVRLRVEEQMHDYVVAHGFEGEFSSNPKTVLRCFHCQKFIGREETTLKRFEGHYHLKCAESIGLVKLRESNI